MVIRNILFPVDFSSRSFAAAPFVYALAKVYDARVVLVHACEGGATPLPESAYVTGVCYEALESASRSQLREFADSELPKIDTLCVSSVGHPAGVILSEAAIYNADLVAMPTHGYGGFRRLLLGSVTARILRELRIPVWTAAHAPEPSHRAHPQPRRILAAVELGAESSRTTEFALHLGRDTGATVEVVHAVVAQEAVAPAAAGARLHDILDAAATAQAVELEHAPSTLDLMTGDPNPAFRLRDLALKRRADLMVIGRGAIQSRLDRFGAHAYEIVRESPCPVISV
jgi:nucleotide-binding universal stress UspA family protein